MKRSISLLALLCVILLSESPMAATFCVQTFTVYGKTAGEHSILFWDMEVGGDCSSDTTFALFLGDDNACVMTDRLNSKEFVPQFLSEVGSEKSVVLTDSSGIYRIADSVYFTVPATDTTFLATFSRLNTLGAMGNGRDWCRDSPVNCIDYPVFSGTGATLIYRYAEGLYKNYRFEQVTYFPGSKYLVLVVDPPVVAHGLDTMRGLLVYRLGDEETHK
jgi:hypothetical protein